MDRGRIDYSQSVGFRILRTFGDFFPVEGTAERSCYPSCRKLSIDSLLLLSVAQPESCPRSAVSVSANRGRVDRARTPAALEPSAVGSCFWDFILYLFLLLDDGGGSPLYSVIPRSRRSQSLPLDLVDRHRDRLCGMGPQAP